MLIVNPHPILIAHIEPPQNEEGGDYYYRTLAPGRAMAREEGVYVINLTNIHKEKERIIQAADVLVLKNVCDPDLMPIIRERKARKLLTVFEIADDINAVQPWSPVYFFYRNPENFNLSRRLSRLSDAMQFTVAELNKIYGYLNPISEVFPNQITIIPPEKPERKTGGLVIGWGGSHGHLEDMAEIAPALIRLIKANQDIHLHLMCSESIWDLFRDLPPDSKKRIKPGSIEDYYAFLKTVDIGLAPLRDTGFNRSRSDVKFLEYAVSGVVSLVHDLIPYRDAVKDGENGFFFRNPDELIRILNRLIADRDLIARVTKTARAYVMAERLEKNHGRDRVGFYRQRLSEIGWPSGDGKGMSSMFKALSGSEGAVLDGRYLRLKPTRFESLLHDGLVLAQVDGDRERAQACFAEASRMVPKSHLPHLFRANSSDNAIIPLNQALTLNPSSIKAWILLGEAHAREGRALEALQAFESAAKIFPEYDIPYARVASVLLAIGEKSGAEDMAKRAQALAVP